MLLFNGSDGAEWPAEIVRIGRNAVDVRVGAALPVDRELPWAVTLAVGVPANDRMDALVEKAGELGAHAIQPLVCERSVLRLSGERAEARRRHWSGVAAAASEQCGRARVTEIRPLRTLAAWLDGNAAADLGAARRLVLSLDPEAVARCPSDELAGAGRGAGDRRSERPRRRPHAAPRKRPRSRAVFAASASVRACCAPTPRRSPCWLSRVAAGTKPGHDR